MGMSIIFTEFHAIDHLVINCTNAFCLPFCEEMFETVEFIFSSFCAPSGLGLLAFLFYFK